MLEVLQDLSQILIWVLGIIIIGLVLLQGGTGDVSSAFGGGGQLDGALGVGANKKLAKITGALSLLFVVMIVILAMPREGDFTESEVIVPVSEPAPSTEPAPTVNLVPEAEVTTEESLAPVAEDVAPDAATDVVEEAVDAAEAVAQDNTPAEVPSEGSGVSFEDEEIEDAAPAEATP